MTDQLLQDEVVCDREPEIVRGQIFALSRSRYDCCMAAQAYLAIHGKLTIYDESGDRVDCDSEFDRRYEQEVAARDAAMLEDYERSLDDNK